MELGAGCSPCSALEDSTDRKPVELTWTSDNWNQEAQDKAQGAHDQISRAHSVKLEFTCISCIAKGLDLKLEDTRLPFQCWGEWLFLGGTQNWPDTPCLLGRGVRPFYFTQSLQERNASFTLLRIRHGQLPKPSCDPDRTRKVQFPLTEPVLLFSVSPAWHISFWKHFLSNIQQVIRWAIS